jgi:hypothetical protein
MALTSGTQSASYFTMKSSGAISHVNVEFVFNVSETVFFSIINGKCDECCVHTSSSGDGDRDSLRNVGHKLHIVMADRPKRHHYILSL